jgi:hypothetical protein
MSKHQPAYLDASQTQSAKKSAVQPAVARESDVVHVVVSTTWFHDKIIGGAMLLGPCGLLVIEKLHCPNWLDDIFDQSEIHADVPEDDEIQEILKLIQDGHARLITNIKHMHVTADASEAFFKNEDESDKDE